MTIAQLVCYDWKPVERVSEHIEDKDAKHHFGPGAKAEDITAMQLRNCTLVYNKALDHNIAKKGKIAARLTSDGILEPEKTGNVTFSRTGNMDATYFFSDDKPLRVPILRYNNGSKVTYCIDYRQIQVIDNLYFGKVNERVHVTTRDLHNGQDSITGTGYPIVGNVPSQMHYAPLREYRAPLAMNQAVTGQATLTPESVAAALTRHSVTNIIGTAMARIARNHQGDLMLCDCV